MNSLGNHSPSFEVAPSVVKGDAVSFVGLDPKNADWFVGQDGRGIEGYFPVGWFGIDDEQRTAIALRDYDAAELSLSVGDSFELEEEYGGWLLVSSQGLRGWVPRLIGMVEG